MFFPSLRICEQDASLPESLPMELPEHNLYDIGTYLHRDVVQTLYRFSLQLGKFDGFLRYITNSSHPKLGPGTHVSDMANMVSNISELRRRLDGFRDRANMSLTLVYFTPSWSSSYLNLSFFRLTTISLCSKLDSLTSKL